MANILCTRRITSSVLFFVKSFVRIFRGLLPLLLLAGVIILFLLIPLSVAEKGYLPPDDALRHAAKAVSGRDWSEIIVQPSDAIDCHKTWHGVLSFVHTTLHCSVDDLVFGSIVVLCFFVFVSPLRSFRYPEAWVSSLLVFFLFSGELYRLLYGRPLLISMACMLMLFSIWNPGAENWSKFQVWLKIAASVFLFFTAALLHGSWYLLSLIPCAFCLASRWKNGFYLGGCWIAGSVLAGIAHGNLSAFLTGQLFHMFHAMHDLEYGWMKVTEFWPSGGDGFPFGVFGIILLVRVFRDWKSGRFWGTVFREPLVAMTLLCWMLGLATSRFWVDWGLPCAVFWVALQIERFESALNFGMRHRLILFSFSAISLFLLTTVDVGGRWSNSLRKEYLDASDEVTAQWLPDPGGILYSTSMSTFYDTFYKNPNGQWKYLLSFEQALMPKDDIKILSNIKWNFGDVRAYQPWVDKMGPKDRLVYFSESSSKPNIPDLEWYYAARGTWLGRKRAPNETPALDNKAL